MVEGCARFSKYLLVGFNLLFALLALATLIVGAVVQVQIKQIPDELTQSIASPILTIIVGVVGFVIAFLGCCGAWKEQKWMLYIFSFILFILMIFQFVSAGLGFALKNGRFEGTLRNGTELVWSKFPEGSVFIDDAQRVLECCGVKGPEFYAQIPQVGAGNVPASCCNFKDDKDCPTEYYFSPSNQTVPIARSFQQGCEPRILNLVQEMGSIIGAILLVIGFFTLLGIIMSCVLIRGIRRGWEFA